MFSAVAAVGIAALCLLIGYGVAWAGGQGGVVLLGMPLLFWCGVLAFVVQWVAFMPAYLRQTERFYDLTGSLTYIGVTLFAVLASGSSDARCGKINPSEPRFYVDTCN